jgi:HSP20 family protein
MTRVDDLWTDMSDQGDKLVIELEVPALQDDVRLDVTETALEVSGERRSGAESRDKEGYQRQWTSSTFRKRVPLPTRVIPERAQARFESGILRIEIPKAEGDRPRKIEID